jgi:hypothetical protein
MRETRVKAFLSIRCDNVMHIMRPPGAAGQSRSITRQTWGYATGALRTSVDADSGTGGEFLEQEATF